MTTDVQALVVEAALRMDARQYEIARTMSGVIAREVPGLDADRGLLELMHASTDANVKTIIHVLVNDIPLERLQPTTAAVEYALRLAQREIPANSLVRAYSVGKDDFIEQVYVDVQALDCSGEDKLAVLHRMSSVASHYVDWISRYVFDVYEQERRRWTTARGNVHASLVHDLLAGRTGPTAAFESETGYRLDHHHVGVVVWSEADAANGTDGTDDLRTLEQLVRRVATATGTAGAPLVTAVDRSTAWAWLPFAARPRLDVAAVRRVVSETAASSLTLGLPSVGAAGFRLSHAQAQAARSVALATTPPTRALWFGDDDVAVTSLLAQDLVSTRAWVESVLGPLAVAEPTAQVLRETLRVFLVVGESYAQTGEQLRVHRNTVKYRVTKALEACPSGNRVDLAVALNACRFLGATVLQPPGRAGRPARPS